MLDGAFSHESERLDRGGLVLAHDFDERARRSGARLRVGCEVERERRERVVVAAAAREHPPAPAGARHERVHAGRVPCVCVKESTVCVRRIPKAVHSVCSTEKESHFAIHTQKKATDIYIYIYISNGFERFRFLCLEAKKRELLSVLQKLRSNRGLTAIATADSRRALQSRESL